MTATKILVYFRFRSIGSVVQTKKMESIS